MASRRQAPQSAPATTIRSLVSCHSQRFVIFASLGGATVRCVVDPQWPCEALLVAATTAYRAAFPRTEVPECNQVFHCHKQTVLDDKMPISLCCASRDKVELRSSVHTHATLIENMLANGGDKELETSEFCVLFHKLPLGFTMKRGSDGTTEVGTIYPKSAATHYVRLAPRVTIASIAGTVVHDMGLRQVHNVIKSATFPLRICFRGPEVEKSSMARSERMHQPQKTTCQTPVPLPSQPLARQRYGSFDGRTGQSTSSHESGRRKSRGRRKRGEAKEDLQQPKEKNTTMDSLAQQGHLGDVHSTECMTEPHLVRRIEQLKVQLLTKHEEAKQIARQLETCSEQLFVLRGNVAPLQPRLSPRSRRRVASSRTPTTVSNLRLTSKVLEAMDQRAGLPRRGRGASVSSNVSSVSGYSVQSLPVPRSATVQPRSGRSSTADNVSVSSSSYTSTLSNTSARQSHSSRGTALRKVDKRYNYMPQKYATTTTGVAESGSTTLSSRGAVMSRARSSRNPFVTTSESPGVGYYDVQVKDRVKGGEIGDSDRSLAWA